MRLNRNSKLLDELWDSSVNMKDWDLSAFDGMYRVEMATGIIPQLPNWRKYIDNTKDMLPVDDNRVSGYNRYFRVGVFGDFGVRLYHYGKDGDDKLYLGLLLEYNNGRFKDYMRLIRPDFFLGRFYIVILGREVFMGYFWLYKTEEYRSRVKPMSFRGLTEVELSIEAEKIILTEALRGSDGMDITIDGRLLKEYHSHKAKDKPVFKGAGSEDVLVIVDEAKDINIIDDADENTIQEYEAAQIEKIREEGVEIDPDEIEVELEEKVVSAEEEIRRSQEDDLEDGWVEEW